MSSEASAASRSVEFLAWLEVNKVRVITVAGILGAVAALVTLYRWHKDEVELQANTALLQAQASSESSGAAAKPATAALLKVADDFSGTSAGARALLLGASALFEERKYAEARGKFEVFLTQDGDSPFAGSAAFGAAACLDAEGKTNEAATAYQGVITRYNTSAAATQARLALAGLQEARGDHAQALRLYTELAASGAQSLWGSEAAQRREDLVRRHPELAPTNAPGATAPALPVPALNLSSSNAPAPPAPGRP
jgi:predicted negative regulator of RcsB-dependent stress response